MEEKRLVPTEQQEMLKKKIKNILETWRELVLIFNDVLLLKESWNVIALVAVPSVIFFVLWLINPPALKLIAMIGSALVMLDFSTPLLILKFYGADAWTAAKEKQLEEICTQLARLYISVSSYTKYFFDLKSTNSKLYYGIVIPTLSMLSWIGGVVNNFFLTYLFVLFVLFLPTLQNRGVIEKYISEARLLIAHFLRKISGTKPKSN